MGRFKGTLMKLIFTRSEIMISCNIMVRNASIKLSRTHMENRFCCCVKLESVGQQFVGTGDILLKSVTYRGSTDFSIVKFSLLQEALFKVFWLKFIFFCKKHYCLKKKLKKAKYIFGSKKPQISIAKIFDISRNMKHKLMENNDVHQNFVQKKSFSRFLLICTFFMKITFFVNNNL